MADFLEFVMFRNSESLEEINYQTMLALIDEDYVLEPSVHEDAVKFEPSEESCGEQEKM